MQEYVLGYLIHERQKILCKGGGLKKWKKLRYLRCRGHALIAKNKIVEILPGLYSIAAMLSVRAFCPSISEDEEHEDDEDDDKDDEEDKDDEDDDKDDEEDKDGEDGVRTKMARRTRRTRRSRSKRKEEEGD